MEACVHKGAAEAHLPQVSPPAALDTHPLGRNLLLLMLCLLNACENMQTPLCPLKSSLICVLAGFTVTAAQGCGHYIVFHTR